MLKFLPIVTTPMLPLQLAIGPPQMTWSVTANRSSLQVPGRMQKNYSLPRQRPGAFARMNPKTIKRLYVKAAIFL